MSSVSAKARIRPGYKIVLTLLLLLLLYAAAGFLLLPKLIREQGAKQLSRLLLRETTIDQVRFNPFSLVLELEGLLIKNRGKEPG
ncbi:MAG: hypothetical protein JXR89_09805, partial [Deltaproteobacteria bacterium]|nr:hypothetical protein [Deltaproteobacteria bacterium]